MNAEAENETGAAAAKLALAAEFLSSPFFTAQIIEAVHTATVRGMSPWLTRADAATYVGCSTSEIDRAARAGVFKTYRRMETPVFKKQELDAALERGAWRKAA